MAFTIQSKAKSAKEVSEAQKKTDWLCKAERKGGVKLLYVKKKREREITSKYRHRRESGNWKTNGGEECNSLLRD
jgi:hypothetical protein